MQLNFKITKTKNWVPPLHEIAVATPMKRPSSKIFYVKYDYSALDIRSNANAITDHFAGFVEKNGFVVTRSPPTASGHHMISFVFRMMEYEIKNETYRISYGDGVLSLDRVLSIKETDGTPVLCSANLESPDSIEKIESAVLTLSSRLWKTGGLFHGTKS